MRPVMTCGISTGFPVLSPTRRQVAHVLLTRSPLGTPLPCGRRALARLACVRRAASVNPEPGSNSPSKDEGPKALTALSHKTLRVFPTLQLSRCSSPPPNPRPASPEALRGRTKPTLAEAHPRLYCRRGSFRNPGQPAFHTRAGQTANHTRPPYRASAWAGDPDLL